MKYALWLSQGGNRDGCASYFEGFVTTEAEAKVKIRELFPETNRFGREWASVSTSEEMTSIKGSGDATDPSDTGWCVAEYVVVPDHAYYDAHSNTVIEDEG